MRQYCDNCGEPMPLVGDCKVCGQRQREEQNHEADHLCAYSEPGRRCQATGVLSKSVNGGGKFYCAAHFKHIDNPRMCSAILDDYETNGIPRRIDWRDQMISDHMAGKYDDETETTTAA